MQFILLISHVVAPPFSCVDFAYIDASRDFALTCNACNMNYRLELSAGNNTCIYIEKKAEPMAI